jgi:hypothetical protein
LATVRLADDLEHRRPVALKVLKPERHRRAWRVLRERAPGENCGGIVAGGPQGLLNWPCPAAE